MFIQLHDGRVYETDKIEIDWNKLHYCIVFIAKNYNDKRIINLASIDTISDIHP